MRRSEALSLVAAAGIAGCAGRTANRSPRPGNPWTVPHTLRWTDAEELIALNPLLGGHAPTIRLSQLWAAWLFRYDERFEPVPELATVVPSVTNGLLSSDGTRITFKLRDALWSDGVPFTSHDVAFSVAVILDPKTNVGSRDGWDKIERVETPDARTAVFHMSEPYAGFLPTFFTTGSSGPCILPEHVVKGQDPNRGPYNDRPIGIGPFAIESWERSARVRLRANRRYWRGRPKLDRLEYRILPGADAAMTALRAHDLDLWVQMSPTYLNQIADIEGITIARSQSTSYRHLDCNCSHPALSEVPVRQALNCAIDRELIIRKALHGVGVVNWSPPLLPHSYAYNEHVPRYPFDMARANRLLEQAGWRRGPDGVRRRGDTRLQFGVSILAASPDWAEIVELIRPTWREVGVAIDSRTYPAALFFGPPESGGIVFGGRFDVCGFAWGGIGGTTGMIVLYGADMIPPAGQNVPRYRNADVTSLLSAATRTLERRAQADLLRRAQRIIAQECPVFPLVQNVDLYVLNSDVLAFRPVPSGPFDFMMNVDV